MIEEVRNLSYSGQSEIGLLDILVTAAENIRLLILGPIIVGILALGVCFVVPQSYTSEAIIALPNATNATNATNSTNALTTQAASLMTSAIVLDPVIVSMNLSEGRPIQLTRKKLANQIKAVVGKDGLLRLDVSANTPAEAQNIGSAVISSWLKSTIPGGDERADLEKRLESARFSLDAVERLLKKITVEGTSNLMQPLTRGEAGTSIVAIGELQTKFLGEVLSIPRILRGYSKDVVKQIPTLPTEPVSPRKGLVVALSIIGSAVILLLWVFAVQAWKIGSADAKKAAKQRRLKKILTRDVTMGDH